MSGHAEKPTNQVNSNPFQDDAKNTVLHYAAAKGDLRCFSGDLKKIKLDVENFLGWTPLMMACKNGHVNVVKTLLSLGADATKCNKYSMSVFLISIAGFSIEIVKIVLGHLLTGGVSKRILERELSPLSMSILFNRHDILEYLIRQNFSIDAKTLNTGITPLMFAAAMSDNVAYAMLEKCKASVNIKNRLGETAVAIKKNREPKKKSSSRKRKHKQITPAEMISRSRHMMPYFPVINIMSPNFVAASPVLTANCSPNVNLLPGYSMDMYGNIFPHDAPQFVTPLKNQHFYYPPDYSVNQFDHNYLVPMPNYNVNI
ncbi:unnamed protein product [Phyllotreta striolata]|uniref:Uncharacterized protein n=1 Tax=Phyllotreta striolata TaxID=444603 RepID=A0A9N9TRE0_PHYSR|nr:unnamed protein product [Phyllotreta striolata]